MSWQPLSQASPQLESRIAWFGKLPGQGDFVGRRMPRAVGDEWDAWLSRGLDQLRAKGSGQWEPGFIQSPLWFFVASLGGKALPICGVLAPSADRIGRCYPITALAIASDRACSLAPDPMLERFFAGTREAIVDARRLAWPAEELDAKLSSLPWPFNADIAPAAAAPSMAGILADLGLSPSQGVGGTGGRPWGAGRDVLRSKQARSVWWSDSPGASEMLEHNGPFDDHLFSRLFKKIAA